MGNQGNERGHTDTGNQCGNTRAGNQGRHTGKGIQDSSCRTPGTDEANMARPGENTQVRGN